MSETNNDISKALYGTLLKRIPPRKISPHLEDIVNVLMNALSRGEVEVNLDSYELQDQLKTSGWPYSHKEALVQSGWLEGEFSPIILKDNHISWRRWHNTMYEVINELLNRSKIKPKCLNSPIKLSNNNLEDQLNSQQISAVQAVQKHGVILISGGPGTGKTSTVSAMLQKALSHRGKIKIGLAASTGKASRRLKDSIQRSLSKLNSFELEFLNEIPSKTLHRWLQSKGGGYGRNKDNPLELDLLVIDEMSMVEVELLQVLLLALPQKTQLILIGDPNQLPPIGSGAIWHKLQDKNIVRSFSTGAIHLEKHYRNNGALALLSNSLRINGLYHFWDELEQNNNKGNVEKHQGNPNQLPSFLIEEFKNHHKKLESISSLYKDSTKETNNPTIKESYVAEKLINCLEEFLVLCPKRNGLWGVNHIHKTLLGKDFTEGITQWPIGTPVICGENRDDLGLANGDIGVVIQNEKNRQLLFAVLSEDNKLITKLINPARLSIVEPAFAITIHKAQGSEANKVVVLWPEEPKKVSELKNETSMEKDLQIKLLYTAITRARKKLDLIIPKI